MERIESLNRCYLRETINIEERTCPERYRVRMLQRNKIEGMLRVDQRNLDGHSFLYYDITGMQNLKSTKCAITIDFMDGFVREMEGLLTNLDAYLLRQEEICLLPEYLWSAKEDKKWKFVYIPGRDKEQKTDIRQLVEFIMDHIDCNDDEGLEQFYGFYSNILSEEFPNIREFIRLWKKGKNEHQKNIEAGAMEKEPLEKEGYDTNFQWKKGDICKEKIYRIPFHGIKIGCKRDVSLT